MASETVKEMTLDQFKGMVRESLEEEGREYLETVVEPLRKEVEKVGLEQAKLNAELDKATKRHLDEAPRETSDEAKQKRLQMAGRTARYLIACNGDKDALIKYAEKQGDKAYLNYVEKELSAGSGGAALVPEVFMGGEFIPLLKEEAVVLKAGPRQVPMPAGNMTIPKQTGAATTGWVGEIPDVSATEPTYDGQLKLSAKKAYAIVPFSRDLVRYSGQDGAPNADEMIREDLVMGLGETIDTALLKGNGSEYSPKGISSYVVSGQSNAMTGSATSATIYADLLKAARLPRHGKKRIRKGNWFMNPRIVTGILKELDANRQMSFLALEILTKGTLLGWPVGETALLPVDTGTGSNEGEVLFADMDDCIYAPVQSIEFEILPPGTAYKNSSGTLVSSASRDEIVVKVLALLDFGVRRDESVSKITGVTWGA